MSVLDILILYFLLNISFVQSLEKVVEELLSCIFSFLFSDEYPSVQELHS